MARIGVCVALWLPLMLLPLSANARPLHGGGGGFAVRSFGGFKPHIVPRALHAPRLFIKPHVGKPHVGKLHVGGPFIPHTTPHKTGTHKPGAFAPVAHHRAHHRRPKLISWGLPFAAGPVVVYGADYDVADAPAFVAANGPVQLAQREPGCRTEDVVVPRATGGGDARVSVIRC